MSTGSSPRPWGTREVPGGLGERVRFIPTPVGNTRHAARDADVLTVHPHARGEHSRSPSVIVLPSGSSPRPWGTPRQPARGLRAVRFIPTPVGNTEAGVGRGPLPAVHPHARGEHGVVSLRVEGLAGSSPRPWGTRRWRRARGAGHRFIPTPVGNTGVISTAARPLAVHPHARGEHLPGPPAALAVHGSSPRPWGTHRREGHRDRPRRFIPTPVGNTRAARPAMGSRAVHPHARGEHPTYMPPGGLSAGSSPRPWGTQQRRRWGVGCCRFIPTPVGNTNTGNRRSAGGSVHPHARGEHLSPGRNNALLVGSSPRPWGTPSLRGTRRSRIRFIPTPVGNTASRQCVTPRTAVHPHARGEHVGVGAHAASFAGSSPRPWGTPVRRSRRRRARRFIPTPVGNTIRIVAATGCKPVHPHARGEHSVRSILSRSAAGSSPRPWGTHRAPDRQLPQGRFIPTPVGNTCCRSS